MKNNVVIGNNVVTGNMKGENNMITKMQETLKMGEISCGNYYWIDSQIWVDSAQIFLDAEEGLLSDVVLEKYHQMAIDFVGFQIVKTGYAVVTSQEFAEEFRTKGFTICEYHRRDEDGVPYEFFEIHPVDVASEEVVMASYNEDLADLKEDCEEEGLPSNGSNFGLRLKELNKWYAEAYPEYFAEKKEYDDVLDELLWLTITKDEKNGHMTVPRVTIKVPTAYVLIEDEAPDDEIIHDLNLLGVGDFATRTLLEAIKVIRRGDDDSEEVDARIIFENIWNFCME